MTSGFESGSIPSELEVDSIIKRSIGAILGSFRTMRGRLRSPIAESSTRPRERIASAVATCREAAAAIAMPSGQAPGEMSV